MAKNQNSKPSPSQPQASNHGKSEAKPYRYVVVRDGHRVSDKEYETPSDPNCLAEINFWNGVSRKQSYGEKVEAVAYDSKKHRVW